MILGRKPLTIAPGSSDEGICKPEYQLEDVVDVNGKSYVKQYIQLASDASHFGLAGIVIGAPSDKNHISDDEIGKVRSYSRDDNLVLLPGVGAQGGEAGAIWKHFDNNRVIVNVGRSLMLPNGRGSSKEQQQQAAEHYCTMLNELRE